MPWQSILLAKRVVVPAGRSCLDRCEGAEDDVKKLAQLDDTGVGRYFVLFNVEHDFDS